MRAVENLRAQGNENGQAPAFVNGFTDGQAARDRNAALTAYLRVGIDDYAKGFRAGFFDRRGISDKLEKRGPRALGKL